jgi:SPP1 gp7 family putative phage head morphogenesis protein
MNINDKIFDRIVDHMADVRLYEEGVQIQNRRILRRHRKNLQTLLRGNVRADLSKEIGRFGTELLSHNVNSLKEFSTSQLDFHSNNLYKEVKDFYRVKRPTTKEILAEVTGPNIKGPSNISTNVRNMSSGELVRIQTKVSAGLARGASQKEIIEDVLKTTKITEFQARTLTRTAITSTQTAAISKVANDNKDILKGFMFTAILDSRTSPICSHHNGKIYDINDKKFQPPLHWNCRSSMIPVLKSKAELIEEASSRINQTNLAKKLPESLTGRAPAVKSFGDWLRTQGMEVQTKMLGSEAAANLFREGKLKAEQFVTQAGKAISIQALRNKATRSTTVFNPRQVVRDTNVKLEATRPSSLVNNPKNKEDLVRLLLLDSSDFNKTFSLTDYKGTSLVGKQESRRRAGNEFDERNFSADPLTGEIKNNNLYDPDFNLYQERIDFMRKSQLLKPDEKDFIESVAASLDDKVSLNQQTVILENLRVVFERYTKDKSPWLDFAAVLRAENRFAVQNVSRLLDTRSRQRSEMFVRYLSGDTPQVQIMGKYYTFDDIQTNQLKDQRFIDAWRRTEGKKLATKLFLSGRAPLRLYFRKFTDKYPTKEKLVKNFLKNNPRIKKTYDLYKLLSKEKEPSDSWWVQAVSRNNETIRRILDLEFLIIKKKPTSKIFDEKALDSLSKIAKLITSGQSTDYDGLAINIGKQFAKDFENIIPFSSHTLKDYHKEGSLILDLFKQQGLIKVQFRGKTRRGILDLDTGRVSGGYKETISREVTVVDKGLLKLQEAERRVLISRRLGVTSDRDRLFVKAGKKTFFDARGNDTGIPIISRDKFADYDAKQIDRDIALMMNHVSNVQYGVDLEFVSFMDDLVRFRDPRGNSKFYDSINEFRHEILNRGEQGYGLMSTAKYHAQRNKNFRTQVFIDSRGRVYHRGYLTPTGGELVRPFLNSGTPKTMTPGAMRELRIQLGAMLGTGTEALTQAGRLEVFRRNESKLKEIGELLLAKTQRDRRLREFLEHPLVRGMEGAEVPKLARMALEYTRVYNHVDGDFSNLNKLSTYKTKLMIENDASSSGAQIIGLSTGDRAVSLASNVLPTTQKNRLYDLVAMDTVNDPEFLKIPALRDAALTWEDLAKAAKAQNMVSFYGAGDATKTANVAGKLSKVLDDKGFVTVTKDNLNAQLRVIDGKIKIANRQGAVGVEAELTSFRKELIELINSNEPVGRTLLKQALDIHPDTADFVNKLTNARRGIIGPKEFAEVSRIMSRNLSERAPVTDKFINYWKQVAKVFVEETQKVDIPWVTFDGKIMTQRYRSKIQERIEFTDPVSGRKIANIYEASAEDGKFLGKGSLNDARIGLGVNGNHSNDAVIVRQFHLWGRRNNVETGTIHDKNLSWLNFVNCWELSLRQSAAKLKLGSF